MPCRAICADPQAAPDRTGHPPPPLVVEGVERNTPDLRLPSPLLDSERWASLVFKDDGFDALGDAVAGVGTGGRRRRPSVLSTATTA